MEASFRSRAGGASHRKAADLGVHVELELLALEFVSDIDIDRSALSRHGIGADLEDTVHLVHPDHRAAVGDATPRGGVIGADASDGRRVFDGIL
jgi:hypothetical protein